MHGALLRDAVRESVATYDVDEVLRRVAGLLAPALGEWCLLDRFDDPDLVTRVAAVGPPASTGQTLPGRLPVGRRSSARAGGLARRLHPGQPLLLDAAGLAAAAASGDPRAADQARLALSLGTVEVLVHGLFVRDQLLGVLTLGRLREAFRPADLDLVGDVAALLAATLDRGRLLTGQRGMSAAMQASLLPPLPAVDQLTLAARYRPADRDFAVGGDWYDAFLLPDGAGLVIGDATGHDLAATARMAELRSVLRALAVDRDESPGRTLRRLERTSSLLASEPSATCLYARVHRTGDSAVLRWSSAGHLPPLLVRAGRGELLETPAELMLGVQGETARTDHERALAPGDLLVLYTDGLVEDRTAHLDVGLAALVRTVEEHAGRHPDLHPDLLTERLLADLGQRGHDDVAILVARVD